MKPRGAACRCCPCCMCLPGCKNAAETLCYPSHFQQMLTFSCSLFSFSPPLLKTINNTTLAITDDSSHTRKTSQQRAFCQQRVPELCAQAQLVEQTLPLTPRAALLFTLSTTPPFGVFLSVACPLQCREPTPSHQRKSHPSLDLVWFLMPSSSTFICQKR